MTFSFPLVVFLVLLVALSFLCLIFSLSFLCSSVPEALTLSFSLTLSAHVREGYSSHFVSQSVMSLFDFGEGAIFRVENYISTF